MRQKCFGKASGSVLGAALLVLSFGCEGERAAKTNRDGSLSAPRPLVSPAAEGSSVPHLAVDPEGTVYLSWIEPRPQGGHAFRWARLETGAWTDPVTIAEGDSFFVNWADFPTIIPLGGDRLVAHWPWKSGEETYAYDVRVSYSTDGGRTWSDPIIPHEDGTPTEHGFVSMLPEGEGVRLVWLDGRDFADKEDHGENPGEGPEMSLRTAALAPGGGIGERLVLDPRVCDCCQTAAVATATGAVVAYRDRSPEEIRDIWVLHFDGSRWSDPYPVHEDRWEIAGCPVNGASLDAQGEAVAIAWYTEGGGQPAVRAAFSSDGGRSFGPPIPVDEGDPLGRVDVIALDDGSALVSWLEKTETGAEILLRRASPGGGNGKAIRVARTSPARRSGFPRMVRSGDRIVFAWTEVGDTTQVRLAAARLTG